MGQNDTLILAGLGLAALFMFRKDTSDVIEGVSTATQGLGAGISTGSQGLGQGISDIGTGIGSGVKQITSAIGDTVEVTGESSSDIISSAGDLGSTALNTVTNLFKGATDFGKAIGNIIVPVSDPMPVDNLGREVVSSTDEKVSSFDTSSLSQTQINFLATLPETEKASYISSVKSRSVQPVQTTTPVESYKSSSSSSSSRSVKSSGSTSTSNTSTKATVTDLGGGKKSFFTPAGTKVNVFLNK